MAGIGIVCDSCRRSWTREGSDSIYVRLELSSRPCPHCGAYTLSYRDDAAAPHPVGMRRPRRNAPWTGSQAQALGGPRG